MKQTKLTDFYKIIKIINIYKEIKIYGYNDLTGSWHCVSCGIDMGEMNPRQYCRKAYCENM